MLGKEASKANLITSRYDLLLNSKRESLVTIITIVMKDASDIFDVAEISRDNYLSH